MKQPKHHRSLARERVAAPAGVDLGDVAAEATYIPYAAHKVHFSSGVAPRLRSDATPCPTDITAEQARTWLRQAIAAGDVGGSWLGKPYPRLVWRRVDDVVFEARLSNQESGEYHGYPIDRQEWPVWLK